MKTKLFLGILFAGLVVLAVGGWTVKGLRRLGRAGSPRLRPAFS